MTLRILFGIFLLLVLRLLAILTIPPHADEIIYLYMADDIARGVRFPIYCYDQQVLGALISWSIAPLFKFFGFSFLGARFLYSLYFFSLMGMYLWIVRRLFGRELTIYLLTLLAILPFPMLYFTTVPGWFDLPFLAMLSLFLLLKVTDDASKKPGWLSWALGFVCGIGVWCNPLFIIWLVPVGISGIWLIPAKEKMKLTLVFLLGFLAGLFPVWIHGLQTGTLMSLNKKGGAGFVSLESLPRAVYLFFTRMKYFLSIFSFGPVSPRVDQLIRTLSFIPQFIFLASFGSFVFHFLRTFRVQKPSEKVFYSFMIIPPLLFTVLYCSRDFSATDEGRRFFIQLLIPYVFVVSWQLERLKSAFWKRGLLYLLVGILLLGNLFSGWILYRKGSELREVVLFLEKKGLHFGIASLEIAYPLNVLSRHRVITTPLPHHAAARWEIWERVKKEGPRYLILKRQNPQLRKELESDPNLKMASVGNYDIFYGESDYLKSILDVQEPILG